MDRYLSCRTLTGKCYFVAEDASEEGVLVKIADHMVLAHQKVLTEAMREKARSLMRNPNAA